jgi:diguanylate cyclase (GGDEF)-like protein
MSVSWANLSLERHWFLVGGVALLALMVLYGIALRGPSSPQEQPISVLVEAGPGEDGQPARLARDGAALLMPVEQGAIGRAELRFVLPQRGQESPHWAVWIPRVPLQNVRLSAGEAWHSDGRSFLEPTPNDGLLPVGYLFRLPSAWEGEIRLQLEATSLRPVAVRPQVVSESLAERHLQRATILTVAAYASLCTLALMGVALFFASRDWSFLTFFGFNTVAVLLIATYNGHLYLLDDTGLLAATGAAGLQAMSLIFEAAGLRIVQRYTDLPTIRPSWARAMNIASVSLLLLAAVLLTLRTHASTAVAWLMPVLWAAGGIAALFVLYDARRRRLPMAGATLVTTTAIVALIVLWELAARGVVADSALSHYGYQIAIVISTMMLGVGLISRISKYRQQRDREQRAREDSERRMYREAVRVELLTALQIQLRGADDNEIQPIALRLLLEHLRRIVPIDMGLVIARGHHGRDCLLSHPAAEQDSLMEHAAQRLQSLRQKLASNIELQQPVTRSDEAVPVAIEAAISLPLRAPAWGLLLLERNGATVFHPDELAIARELSRMVVLQIDEAFTALQLRQTAELDALTGSLNRRSIDQSLIRWFQQAHRTNEPLSVLFVDLDHFKTFNDVFGHACGDHCLRELARTMRAALGEDDIFGRYGGEEFIVILPGRQSEMARAIAEELRIAVEAGEIQWQDRALRLTVSIGVASRLEHESVPQPTLERADKALYAAKRSGRNRIQVAPAVFQSRSETA